MLVEKPDRLYLGVDHEPAEEREVYRWLAVQSNKRCSNARLVASGYEFRYPTFREG